MHLVENGHGGAQSEAGAAKFLGDQGRKESRLRHRSDELCGIGALTVQRAPVFPGKARAQPANRLADFGKGVASEIVHRTAARVVDISAISDQTDRSVCASSPPAFGRPRWMKRVTSAPLPSWPGSYGAFSVKRDFAFFSPLRCSKGARSGARSRPAPGLRSLGNARRRWPEPCQGRSRRRRGPKARLYEGPAIAENRPPRSVGRFAIARCSTCLPFLDECGRGWISRRS